MGFSVAAGLLLGSYLDNKFETSTPYFTLIGLIAGVVTGFTMLFRILKMKERKENENNE
ncbi:MAG: hypothetical protein GTO02_08385 [Candidatus Dadabacteria bacterium]|nr:hypothetical protein [Candidatus Dadabacteria bacterium]NIQ14404.1 hypothetical protein [Candidatus Dadabacteria bacterium]